MSSQNSTESETLDTNAPKKIDIAQAEPKVLFRKLALDLRTDDVTNHEASLILLNAYEKAKEGSREELIEIFKKRFPDLVLVEGNLETEPDEFEKEQQIRKEIHDIIFDELHKLFEISKKIKDTSIIRNSGLQVRYKNLCAERGISFSSDFKGMKYDQQEIYRDLYAWSKSMAAKIKTTKQR